MNARLILEAAERVFPLAEMGADFKGHHNLTLHEGAVALTVWTKGKCHTFSLGDQEEAQTETADGCDQVAAAIRDLIAKR